MLVITCRIKQLRGAAAQAEHTERESVCVCVVCARARVCVWATQMHIDVCACMHEEMHEEMHDVALVSNAWKMS